MQVFDIEDMGKGGASAVVARPRDCTMCRECIRHEGWDARVNLKRLAKHFIFTVESSGCLDAQDIVKMVCIIPMIACTLFSPMFFRRFKFFETRPRSYRS